jgi:asparagine synthase (glutamine-hydrolysing)
MSIGLRRAARAQGIRVLLTGIGGDEWFSGSRFRIADDLRGGRVVRAVRHAMADARLEPGVRAGAALWAFGVWPCVPHGAKRVARALRGAPTVDLPWITEALVAGTRLAQRIRVRPSTPDFPTAAQAGMFNSALGPWSMHGTEMEARLAADLGIELRHPLADLRVARFGLAIPESLRSSNGERKRVLRAAAAGLVPEAVRWRASKVDFSPVVVQALEAQGGGAFFTELGTAALGWTRPEPLQRMYADMRAAYVAGDPGYMGPAWTLWMISGIERWARAAGFAAHRRRPIRATA